MTDQAGREHDVRSEEFGAGQVAGVYRSVCGALITPAALTAPAGAACPACVWELDPGPEVAAGDAHTERRVVAAWLRRLPMRVAGPGAASLATAGGPR